ITAINDGAIAKPATNRARPITGIDPTKVIGTMTSAMAVAATCTRKAGGRRQATAPVARPAIMLPSDQHASSTPANGLACCSAEKATVLTSAAANMEPRAHDTAPSTTTGGQGIGGRGADVAVTGWGTGWLERCAASTRIPGTPVTRASPSPAHGCH